MESNPLLAALQNNYGDGSPPPPDPNTVRGLLAYCKLWLDGEVETSELNNPCMAMAGRLKVGARDTEADLRQNPDMIDSARAPIERIAEAYWTIVDILLKLPQLAADNSVDEYRRLIEEFEQERQAVLDCQAEIEKSMSGDVLLCPRCAAQGDEAVCPRCQLVRLFPDPRATEYDPTKTAMLAPVYKAVNDAFSDVMSGKASLPTIHPSVDALEAQLLEFQKLYEQALEIEAPTSEEEAQQHEDSVELSNRMLDLVDKAFAGIDRIRGVDETLRMSDLSRGWDTIFDAAVEIQTATRRYAKAYGMLDELDGNSDLVQLSGE